MIHDIKNAKYIVIVTKSEQLPQASALYTYILTLHKKVSLVCEGNVNPEFMFLPWINKVKSIKPLSADLFIDLKISTQDLYRLFVSEEIKPNQKIATALYAGLLYETQSFTNQLVNGIIFKMAKELVEFGADINLCVKYIVKTTTLSMLRLKAIMFKNMILKKSSSLASFCVDDDDLKSSGTTLKECEFVMLEALNLTYVYSVELIKTDENNKIIKIINKEI
jgi:phosphoesterase RecJ-like protein